MVSHHKDETPCFERKEKNLPGRIMLYLCSKFCLWGLLGSCTYLEIYIIKIYLTLPALNSTAVWAGGIAKKSPFTIYPCRERETPSLSSYIVKSFLGLFGQPPSCLLHAILWYQFALIFLRGIHTCNPFQAWMAGVRICRISFPQQP